MFTFRNSSGARRSAIALATAAMVGASALATFPASAQQLAAPYSGEQCRSAKIIIGDVYSGFVSKGGLSREFVSGVNTWAMKGCQGPINTVAMIDNDEDAFKQIRVRLIAMRSQASAQPTAFSR